MIIDPGGITDRTSERIVLVPIRIGWRKGSAHWHALKTFEATIGYIRGTWAQMGNAISNEPSPFSSAKIDFEIFQGIFVAHGRFFALLIIEGRLFIPRMNR